MLSNSSKSLWFLLFFVSSVLIFPYTWIDGSVRVDAYTYSSQAAMLAAQNTLFPEDERVQKEFHFFEHPLLFKWLQALVFKVVGISEYSSKLLSGLMGCFLVLMVYGIGAFFFTPFSGFLAGLFLLLSPRFLIHSSLCLLDIPLIFFISLSIFSAIFAIHKHKVFYLLSGFSLSCAFLTKGAFGLLPIPVILFYLLISKRWKDFYSPYFIVASLIPLLCVWMYNFLLSFSHPGITLASFWRTQGYAPTKDYFFYVKTIFERYFYLLIPTFLLFWTVRVAPKRGPHFSALARTSGVFWRQDPHRRKFVYMLLWWCICTIGALTYVQSKKQGYYLLPLNPALALLAGIACASIVKEHLQKKIIYSVFFATILMAWIFSTTPFPLHKEKVLRERAYWKQFSDLEWQITKILNEGRTLYYSPGLHYILNFKWSKQFAKKQILPIEQIKNEKKIYFLSNKDFNNLRGEKIGETKDLYLIVLNAYNNHP